MRSRLFQVTCIVAAMIMLLPGSALPAAAQGDPPPPVGPEPWPPGALGWPGKGDARTNAPIAEGPSLASVAPQATGGPDDFGYTWDDSALYNWIDATSGTDSGVTGDDRVSSAIDIGFSFKFYENTYTQVYFDTNGLVTFAQNDSAYANTPIPNPSQPNNLIAPFWDDLTVGQTYNPGKIYYKRAGIAPDRSLVIEWFKATACCGSNATDYKTFEVILYENGSAIVIQYQSMSGYLQYATVGIEDAYGVSGLQYLYSSPGVSNGKAIRFTRPGPGARVSVSPQYQGKFVRAGEILTFTVPVRNTGELGNDTYDLSATPGWPVTFYLAAGGPSVTNTGPVGQGSVASVLAEIQVPGGVTLGQANTALVTVRSTRDSTKSRTASLQAAVPAPFAQVYQDNADGAMQLYLAQPAGQLARKVTSNSQYGYDPAIAEMPNGNFIYAWDKSRCLGTGCSLYIYDIEYAVLNQYGQVVRGVTKLTDNSAATLNTYDYWPAVAPTPDGHVGVLWRRYISKPGAPWTYNYNVFFAILDAAGELTYGPVNLTNSTAWGNGPYGTWQYFDVPELAATGDNRFVLTWMKENRVAGCTVNDCYLDDVYYTVRDTGGNAVKGLTKFTADTSGNSYEGYWDPNLTPLTSNRALLTWQRGSNGDIYYAVLDSAGQVYMDKTDLSAGSTWGYGPDAVQLSNDYIVVAWTAGGTDAIRFAVLDPTYSRTAGPTTLSNPAAPAGSDYVSVAADDDGRAILTWIDYATPRTQLYYALVDSTGATLTAPMIFRTTQGYGLYTSYGGNGNTSWSNAPAAGVDLEVWPESGVTFGVPGVAAVASVHLANYGLTLATGVMLTATLDANLDYLGDTSGLTPSINDNVISWDFSQLAFLEEHAFSLYLSVPGGAAPGDRYPVTLELASNEQGQTTGLTVVAPFLIYLPRAMR